MLNTVRKKKKKEVLKIHVFIQNSSSGLHDILVQYANQPCLFLSFPCFLVNVTQRVWKLKIKKVGSAASGSLYHLIKLARA